MECFVSSEIFLIADYAENADFCNHREDEGFCIAAKRHKNF